MQAHMHHSGTYSKPAYSMMHAIYTTNLHVGMQKLTCTHSCSENAHLIRDYTEATEMFQIVGVIQNMTNPCVVTHLNVAIL